MRKIKSVAFNTADPYELKLINHFQKFPNFSSYIKRLIQRDMEGGQSTITKVSTEDDYNTDDLMKNML